MRQLTSLDAQFLALENARTQGHVSVLGVYDANTASGRPLDAALVRELVTERMHLLPTFRWRLAPVPFGLDYPYWVDDGTFDVEYHVRELALPSPGNERQLAEQVADLIGRQLDRARPLWEVYVIHGLQDGAVAVLTKMHHAAVDGVSGAEVMSILLDDTAAGREFEPTPAVVGERFPSEVQMLGRGLVGMLRQPLRVLRAAPTTLPHLDDVATLRHLAGVKTIARSGRMIKRLIPAGGDGSALQGNDVVAPPDSIPNPHICAPPSRVRIGVQPGGPKASCTRIGRWYFTPWLRRCPTSWPYRQGTQSFRSSRCSTRTRGGCPTPQPCPERGWSSRGRISTPTSVLDLLAEERVTMTAGVPTVRMGMLAALDAEPRRWDLSALDRLVVGGAAVPRSMLEGFDRHGLSVIQAWGLTETAPLGSVCRLPASLDESTADEQYQYRARQGIASPLFEIRARDDEGQFIKWDDAAMGELEVRGPWVTASYHRGRGADSFNADGWFKTGDVVRINAHGCIKICDRSKDLVKSGGEWISSVDPSGAIAVF